ncbi:MAG: hypothetical protein QG608_1022 [Actinomycetota bacterium]|nr:hypothetical protein [Actinomycetota bacterium]
MMLPRIPQGVDFRRLLIARLVTTLAGAGTPVLLTLTVLAHGGSFQVLGLVLGVGSLPGIVSVLASGSLFRRVSATRLMFWLDVTGCGVCAVLCVMDFGGGLRVPMLTAASLVVATAQGLAYPASGLIMPKVLPREDLQAGNALRSLVGSVAGIVGPATVTVLLAVSVESVAWGVVAVAFGVGAMLIRRVSVVAVVSGDGDDDRVWPQLRAGWSYFWGRRWIAQVVVLAGVWHVFVWAFVLVLGPVVLQTDHGDAISWGAFETLLGVGGVLGGIVGGRLRCRRLIMASLACLFPGVAVGVALAAGAPIAVVLLLSGCVGASLGLAGIFWPTAMQALVPEDRLAQMFSYDYLLSEAVMPFGLLLAPLAAAWCGPHLALAIGCLSTGVLMVASLASPPLRVPVVLTETT